MDPIVVHVWSDIACPWCYVGKRRFEAALQSFEHADALVVEWRSFELDPAAPPAAKAAIHYAERLAKKYGTTMSRGQAMVDRMVNTGAEVGLAFDFEHIRPGNTFDAHRLLHLAAQQGVQSRLKERLFAAYFREGARMSDHETLLACAIDAGLDADRARATLASEAYAREVRADEEQAHGLGITGVPFFVVGRYGVSGAQPPAVFSELLERVARERRVEA